MVTKFPSNGKLPKNLVSGINKLTAHKTIMITDTVLR